MSTPLITLALSLLGLVQPPPPAGDFCFEGSSDWIDTRYEDDVPICERNLRTSDKRRIYRQYGIQPQAQSKYEIDHFYALSLGGSNEDENLWPLLRELHREKTLQENGLRERLIRGEIRIRDVWRALDDRWRGGAAR